MMSEEFKQVTINLKEGNPKGALQIKKLLTIITKHQYYEETIKAFNIDPESDDVIVIENVDVAFNAVKAANENFEKVNLIAETKDVDIRNLVVDEEKVVEFAFENGRIDDELKEDLAAEAIYSSKNSFFDQYSMSKYANYLYVENMPDLVNQNISYFKNLALKNKEYNKIKSYRLLAKKNKYYLRAITSEKYKEYGIDFTFFVAMILLHTKMQQDKGNNYSITYLSLSESKLDMIINDKRKRNVEHFGKITLGINVSTNELGTGSLNVKNVLRIEGTNEDTLLYLIPREHHEFQIKNIITHTVGIDKIFMKLNEIKNMFDIPEEFVQDMKDISGLKNPDELRYKIQIKIEHPNSIFKDMHELKDIFKSKINNQIDHFSKLLEMCKKAEELEMDYDIRDKLRYIISDIILYGNSK